MLHHARPGIEPGHFHLVRKRLPRCCHHRRCSIPALPHHALRPVVRRPCLDRAMTCPRLAARRPRSLGLFWRPESNREASGIVSNGRGLPCPTHILRRLRHLVKSLGEGGYRLPPLPNGEGTHSWGCTRPRSVSSSIRSSTASSAFERPQIRVHRFHTSFRLSRMRALVSPASSRRRVLFTSLVTSSMHVSTPRRAVTSPSRIVVSLYAIFALSSPLIRGEFFWSSSPPRRSSWPGSRSRGWTARPNTSQTMPSSSPQSAAPRPVALAFKPREPVPLLVTQAPARRFELECNSAVATHGRRVDQVRGILARTPCPGTPHPHALNDAPVRAVVEAAQADHPRLVRQPVKLLAAAFAARPQVHAARFFRGWMLLRHAASAPYASTGRRFVVHARRMPPVYGCRIPGPRAPRGRTSWRRPGGRSRPRAPDAVGHHGLATGARKVHLRLRATESPVRKPSAPEMLSKLQ